jgi:LacI family transcriptional regulator
MTRHLLALGHRRIGFLAGAAHNADARERERGHREALRAAGIARDPALEVRGDFTEEGGARGAGALMALAAPPTAIFAANDAMAVGALSTLRELGIAVPRRVAVVGFDDIPIARYMSPPLSSVHVDISTLGERATARLMEGVRTAEGRGSGDGRAPPHETLPTTLVIRDSCGARRKDG